MNIGQLIENPFQDLSSYTSDLEKLVQKNSYSSTVMMLYLKALKDSKSIDFEDNLKKTAILCQDRTVLFDFIKNENLEGAPIVDKIEKVVEEQSEDTTTEKPEVLEALSEVKTENIDIPPTSEEVVEPEEKSFDTAAVKEDKIDKSQEPEATEEEKDESIFELNKDIYARAVHASIHNEEEDEDDDSSQATIPAEPKETILEKQEDDSKNIDTPSKAESSSPDIKHSGEKLSFIDWLKAQQGEMQTKKSEPAKEVSAQGKEPEQAAKPQEVKDENDDAHRSDINAIVEKFIKEEPTITRRKAEFFSPSETAKKSIEENDNIVTETLAEIYVNQGNYKKAIAAYEQLILKFPKKKSFFADRINFIKNLK